MVNAPETVESLKQRLNQCEHALHRCERLAVASPCAGAVMHEVNNPLAAITNLVFLTKLQARVQPTHCEGHGDFFCLIACENLDRSLAHGRHIELV